MPRGDWRVILAALGLLIGVPGSAIFVQHVDQTERQQPTAEQPHKPPAKSRSDIARLADAVQSVAEDESSAGEEDRSRRDLDANEGQERWARWAAWAGFIQLFLSVGGIVLVVRSLNQTQAGLTLARDANALTREALETEQRAWLDLDVLDSAYPLTWDDAECSYNAMISIENLGATPALEVALFAMITFRGDIGRATQEFRDEILNGKPASHPFNLYRGKPVPIQYNARHLFGPLDDTVEGAGSMIVGVRYHTLFDGEPKHVRTTIKIYDLSNGPGGILRKSNCPSWRDRLEILPNAITPGYIT